MFPTGTSVLSMLVAPHLLGSALINNGSRQPAWSTGVNDPESYFSAVMRCNNLPQTLEAGPALSRQAAKSWVNPSLGDSAKPDNRLPSGFRHFAPMASGPSYYRSDRSLKHMTWSSFSYSE